MIMIQRFILVCFFVLFATVASAQQYAMRDTNTLQKKIVLLQDERMDEILYKAKNNAVSSENNFVTISGFRVQVYAGNHPQKAREDAMQIDKTIKEQYPQYHAYVSFTAPFWRVRIGDFASYYEALLLSRELKTIFPEFGNEIYVVKDATARILYF